MRRPSSRPTLPAPSDAELEAFEQACQAAERARALRILRAAGLTPTPNEQEGPSDDRQGA